LIGLHLPLSDFICVRQSVIKKKAGNQKVVGLKNVTRRTGLLTTSAFRSFERVDLDIVNLDFDFTMSREVTQARLPF
jgi:hypothetical protein